MGSDHQLLSIALPATLPQISNQLLTRFELGPGRLISVKIADQTDAKPNVVHVIAVNMSAGDLAPPTIANLDLAVARRGAVPDYEVIG
jgi:hypothetical protein